MVELEHRSTEPVEMTDFKAHYSPLSVDDFNGQTFNTIKPAIRQALSEDQYGLCVYCERKLDSRSGQIDHIRPKAGKNAHPELCFTYTNYAYGCITNDTCGQKKKNGLLPIEPAPDCNRRWFLETNGALEPVIGQTRQEVHEVTQTRDMLGLNRNETLVRDRKKQVARAIEIAKSHPERLAAFIEQSPFRFLLSTVFRE